MEISISITVPFFGLQLKAQIDGGYLHGEFDPSAVYLDTLAGQTGQRQWQMSQIGQYLPTFADVSDFYSAHAAAIDEAVQSELADHAEAASDTYESLRQEEIDDEARV